MRESLHTNRASFAIALGKSVAADLLRFADKSAHQVRSCTSVCLTTCEFEFRYLHQVKLRMKSSWLFNLAKFERAVPTGPKRHTVQQMISTNRNCSYRAIALGKSVAADLLRFADKSAHQVRSSTSVVSHDMRVRVSLSAPSKATNEKFVAFYLYTNRTSSSARTEKTHGSADDFNQSQLLLPSNRSWEISCS